MGERISENAVVDRSKYPKQALYIDKEGYLCKAEFGGRKLSPEEKEKRESERKIKREQKVREGKKLREVIASKKKAYNKAIKTMNLDLIKDSLTACETAKKEYEDFKNK